MLLRYIGSHSKLETETLWSLNCKAKEEEAEDHNTEIRKIEINKS